MKCDFYQLVVSIHTPSAFAARPERIIEWVQGNSDKKVIVVDKVQKILEILSAVHSLIEEKANKKFILTGFITRK